MGRIRLNGWTYATQGFTHSRINSIKLQNIDREHVALNIKKLKIHTNIIVFFHEAEAVQ